jgi:acyl-CoA synthetase (AMP-forming)/AMP-acid ligase II
MTFRTVGDLVDVGARRSPARVAVKLRDGPAILYGELASSSNRLANALLAHGLAPGDRIGVWLEDRLEYPIVYLAAAKAGLVVVPINALFRPAEASYQLADSGARALIWSDGLASLVDELEDLSDDLLLVSTDGHGPEGTQSLQALIEGGRDVRPASPAPDDVLVLAYTSGTTGHPKGAMLTHRTALAICRLNTISYHLPAFSVAAITGTLSFPAMVPAHVLSHLYVGGTSVIMGRWDPEVLVDTIERERVTFAYLPTPTMSDFAAYAARVPARWASLESVLHSASRATPEQRAELCEVIGDRFVEGWGMTENSGGLMTATTRADVSSPPTGVDVHASVGRPVVEMLVEVVDGDGNRLPHDGETMGELVYRGPAVMKGYWNRPVETAGALRDGWLYSGDLGVIDPHGYVFVAERRTDLIVSGGMNVYPSEVERVIMRLPKVRECVVVGAPHERWGQTVVAVVVGSPGVTEEEVIAACRSDLASYKKPTRVLFVDDVPRTVSLKVRRAEVRELVARAAESSQEADYG